MATVTFSIGTAVGSAGTGNVDTDGTTAVTSGSVATAFTSELTRPGTIEIAGTLFDIASITDDDNLVTEQTVPTGTNQSYNIGTRHYSTITLWEADLDDTVPYDASDDAVGECFDDSAFDEQVLFDGGPTIGLASVTLTVASGERHDGTAGTGARIVLSGKSSTNTLEALFDEFELSWLEVDDNEKSSATSAGLIINDAAGSGVNRIALNIFHGIRSETGGNCFGFRDLKNDATEADINNNIFYDLTSTDEIVGIVIGSVSRIKKAQNNTIHDLISDDANDGFGVETFDQANTTVQNNIVTDVSNTGSGAGKCYSLESPVSSTIDHNLASDTTASGTGSLDSKSAANQFVSTTGGSEDLHLKTGADAIDAGTDLGTTPSGVEIDIDGRDRDAEGDTWDMGADEFVAAALSPVEIITMLNRDKINPIRLM